MGVFETSRNKKIEPPQVKSVKRTSNPLVIKNKEFKPMIRPSKQKKKKKKKGKIECLRKTYMKVLKSSRNPQIRVPKCIISQGIANPSITQAKNHKAMIQKQWKPKEKSLPEFDPIKEERRIYVKYWKSMYCINFYHEVTCLGLIHIGFFFFIIETIAILLNKIWLYK